VQGEQLFLVWETEFVPAGPNQAAMVRAKRPLSTMHIPQAAKILGVSEDTVSELYRAGLIDGYKPGARRIRRDGRASNARLVLHSESVLRYKAEREAQSRKERGF
jgi:excisionase family DNA binding protein